MQVSYPDSPPACRPLARRSAMDTVEKTIPSPAELQYGVHARLSLAKVTRVKSWQEAIPPLRSKLRPARVRVAGGSPSGAVLVLVTAVEEVE